MNGALRYHLGVRMGSGQTVTPLYMESRVQTHLQRLLTPANRTLSDVRNIEANAFRGGKGKQTGREWTSMDSLHSPFQLVPRDGTNDHPITERDTERTKYASNGEQQPRNSVILLDDLEHID